MVLRIIAFMGCLVLLAEVSAVRDELYDLVYAESGQPIGNEKTLEALKELSTAYENVLSGKTQTEMKIDEDDISDELKDINTMIDLSSLNNAHCDRSFFKSISYIIYANKASSVNLVPYLDHFRFEQYKQCAGRFAQEETQTMAKFAFGSEITSLNHLISEQAAGLKDPLESEAIVKGVAKYMSNHYSKTALDEIVKGDQDAYDVFLSEDILMPCEHLLKLMHPIMKIYYVYEDGLVPKLRPETVENYMKVRRCQSITDDQKNISQASLVELKKLIN